MISGEQVDALRSKKWIPDTAWEMNDLIDSLEAMLKVVEVAKHLTEWNSRQLTVGYMRRELRRELAPFTAQRGKE